MGRLLRRERAYLPGLGMGLAVVAGAAVVAGLGAAVGRVVGALAVPLPALSVPFWWWTDVRTSPTLGILAAGLGLAIVASALGAWIGARQAGRVQPAEAMRRF